MWCSHIGQGGRGIFQGVVAVLAIFIGLQWADIGIVRWLSGMPMSCIIAISAPYRRSSSPIAFRVEVTRELQPLLLGFSEF